jgi:hypothetical protein
MLLPFLSSDAADWLRVVVIGQRVPRRVGTVWESMATETIVLEVPGPEDWLEYGLRCRGDGVFDLRFVTQLHENAGGRPGVLVVVLGPRS